MVAELIIGANGYLGQYLAIARRGSDCLLHSRSTVSPICRETSLAFVQEDLTESRRVLSEIDPQTVYLLARPPTQDASILLDFGQNVQWLLQEWADRGCLRRVVFASTQLVYATPPNDTPLAVGCPLGPETAYDCHKAGMEFFLALLSHHQTPVKIEVYRLPLLGGRPATPVQAKEQFLYRWRNEYQTGHQWVFPVEDQRHVAWGNSWAHVDDVVSLMKTPQESRKRFQIIQPVSGHLSYVALDRYFRARYPLPQARASLYLPKTSFYLQDNANLKPRPIEEAFPEDSLGAE